MPATIVAMSSTFWSMKAMVVWPPVGCGPAAKASSSIDVSSLAVCAVPSPCGPCPSPATGLSVPVSPPVCWAPSACAAADGPASAGACVSAAGASATAAAVATAAPSNAIRDSSARYDSVWRRSRCKAIGDLPALRPKIELGRTNLFMVFIQCRI